MLVLQQTAFKKPEAVIKAEADQGDAEAALDYGLRLYIGLGCKRNRSLSRVYLVKVVSSPSASDTLKATAHGMLIDWCVQASLTDFRSRYLLAASHHANLAAALCRRVTPPGTHSSAAVLWFMKNVFQRQAADCPQLYVFYKDAMRALDERDAQLKGSREKMQQKRLKNPNRYRCAAVGCGVQADTGKMLSQCSGQCDPDKKPSYCSKECQKADWKNHKPFCLPGAECSVIDDGTTSHEIAMDAGPASKSGSGAIQLPITHANGSKTFVSSSTLDAQMLKEIRDLAGNRELSGVPSSLTVEMERVTF
ncbi:hypothetical protein BDZ97DRAFT_1922743 [Flammula alnicola]|nr:hypothetical protein BDZ97DRAFT_1922743 [Flammula alnicola]